VFIDILVNLLGIIPPVKDDVSKREIRVAPLQFIEQEKNSLLIVYAGRSNDGCHGDTVDGSEAVGLVAHGILVRVMPFPGEGNAFVLEPPVTLVILFTFGRTAGDQECGIGNQDDPPLPMLPADQESPDPADPGNGPEERIFCGFPQSPQPQDVFSRY